MKTGKAMLVLVVLAAAATLTAVAAARPDAARQRVMITTQAARMTSTSPFVLTPLREGAIKPDAGTWTNGTNTLERVVIRDGQSVEIYEAPSTLKGKLGSLTVRYRSEWVAAGTGYYVSFDTWKVVRGTGQYAGITGGGRGGSVSSERGPWSSRVEGFLTRP